MEIDEYICIIRSRGSKKRTVKYKSFTDFVNGITVFVKQYNLRSMLVKYQQYCYVERVYLYKKDIDGAKGAIICARTFGTFSGIEYKEFEARLKAAPTNFKDILEKGGKILLSAKTDIETVLRICGEEYVPQIFTDKAQYDAYQIK